jgi:hypothetical protein
MSNVVSVIITTTNKMVVSANSAVSIGRWSNLAIIASFLSLRFVYVQRTLKERVSQSHGSRVPFRSGIVTYYFPQNAR